MPHSTRLPYTLCSPHGGETSQGSCTRASPAAQVTNDLGELPSRLEGSEILLPDLPPTGGASYLANITIIYCDIIVARCVDAHPY